MQLKKSFFEQKYRLIRPQARHTLAQLVDIEGTPSAVLRALNEQRRTEIVTHAFDTSPYYHCKFRKAGFERKDLLQPDNFFNLPVLTRENVKENFDSIISSDFGPAEIGHSSTGGSTGVPLVIGTDPHHGLEVISWRRLQAWGASAGDNSGYIYRVTPRGLTALLRRFVYFPTRRSYLSAADMSEANMARFVNNLQHSGAVYVVAYVGALKIFSDYIAENKIELPNLQFAWSTAAPMPRYLRKELEGVLGVPVYSQYGSCEFYWIAAERLDRRGMDVDWDIRTVEVLDEAKIALKDGEYGNLVITDLLNRAFPLIRYEIGDRGRFLPREVSKDGDLPILDFVKGRTSDTITLREGRRVPGEFWTTVFDPYADHISGFYVHQNRDHSIEVRFNPNETWTSEHREGLIRSLTEVCGDTPFELLVENATNQVFGKLKFVSSEVD